MNRPQHFEIVMVLLRQGSYYCLQLRNGKGQSGGLGLIGCFGGEIEPGETAIEAACREVGEESNVVLAQDQLAYLGDVHVVSEKYNKQATIHARIYRAEVAPHQKVAAREGELVKMTLDDMRHNIDTVTSGTAACINELLKEEE